jgi:hypothetical protein
MESITQNFTQGGQTQLHNFRMIKQVVGATLKVSLWIFVIVWLGLLFKNHVWQDFWFLFCYGKALLRIEHFSYLPSGFFDSSWLVNYDGSQIDVSDYWMLHQPHLQLVARSICLSIIKKLLQSLFISIIGSILISWFWVFHGKKKNQVKIISGFKLG